MTMNQLKVAFLPELDEMDSASIERVMEVKAPRVSIDRVNWPEFPYKPVVAVSVARSERDLYLLYRVWGNSLKASAGTDDTPVHRDSCVEFFMRKEGSPQYMNFEFNCAGTCDAARRLSREEKTSLTPDEYRSIRRYPSVERRTFDEIPGLHAWSLLVAIPFAVMDLDPARLPERIWGNFYKCADDTAQPHFLSWNPIDLPAPDFHCPAFFGEIYL